VIKFSFRYDTDFAYLEVQPEKRGMLGLLRGKSSADLLALPKEERELSIALFRLRHLDPEGRLHSVSANGLRLAHPLVVRLDSLTARTLGLPDLISNLTFKASMVGTIGSHDFRIQWWWEQNGRTVSLPLVGAFVGPQSKPMRLPAPIYQAIEIAREVRQGTSLSDHWLALGEFRRLFDATFAPTSDARLDGLLRNISVTTTDAIGLALDEEDDSVFRAVPYVSREVASSENGQTPTAVIGRELATFQALAAQRGAQPAYRVGDGKFLILDRSAIPVLSTIAEYARKEPEERRAFIANAGRIISEAIERQMRDDGRLTALMSIEARTEKVEEEAAKAWVETPEWVSRVTGIAKWKAMAVDPMMGSGTTWLPSMSETQLGEYLGLIPDEDLADLVEAIKAAMAAGEGSVTHAIGPIPVTEFVLEALSRRLAEFLRAKVVDPAGRPMDAFLPVTHDNFWELDYERAAQPRKALDFEDGPPEITTPLQVHQRSSLSWQLNAWKAGLPGILNADEQGLGKTLQTISLMVSLKKKMLEGSIPKRPFLIVAPTSLLLNWEAELSRHLVSGFMGTPVRLFGDHLSMYKKEDSSGQDIREGEGQLAIDKIMAAQDGMPVVITTYQTLANYAISLMELRCAVAVLDEIQFVKNPATMRAIAAKSIHADFKIGLTGTPIENATHDLWAIMDQLFPGALGARTQFKRIFDLPTEENMTALHSALFYPQHGRPPLAQRRLKTDAAPQLPTKVRVLHPREMPAAQMIRYDEARSRGGMILALLHHIRRTSLHPGLLDGEAPDDFVASSARVAAAMDILRHIKEKNERALVFVESRDVQAWFAELVRLEFDLPRVFVINGDTTIDARKEITDRFQGHLQEDKGFDVLVLGPRAAGTGLTLTAANHVIHLSRWWNPAVEEQCNDRTHRIGQTKPVTVHIPLAVHPRLGPGSFDCLLQRLMKRKRSLAERVLWPAEATERETKLLYDAVIAGKADRVEDQTAAVDNVRLEGRDDLISDFLTENTIRVRPKRGGASVLISSDQHISAKVLQDNDDAVVITMHPGITELPKAGVPHSRLMSTSLWPDFVLPE
jgi:hypothetical protein